MLMKQVAFGLVLLCVGQLQIAQAWADGSGFYAGYKGGRYWNQLFRTADREWAHGPYLGFRLHEFVAIEAEYLFQNETADRVTYEGEVTVVSLRPTLPLTSGWELYAKLGWAWVEGDFKLTADSPQGSAAQSLSRDKAFFGLGTRWSMGPVTGRFEYQFDDSVAAYSGPDLGFAMLGIEFEF